MGGKDRCDGGEAAGSRVYGRSPPEWGEEDRLARQVRASREGSGSREAMIPQSEGEGTTGEWGAACTPRSFPEWGEEDRPRQLEGIWGVWSPVQAKIGW